MMHYWKYIEYFRQWHNIKDSHHSLAHTISSPLPVYWHKFTETETDTQFDAKKHILPHTKITSTINNFNLLYRRSMMWSLQSAPK